MTTPSADLAPTAPARATVRSRPTAPLSLRTWRLNLMRVGYLVMAVGIALNKWPLFAQGTVASLPVFEGVVAAVLGSMSVLFFVGLRYPLAMLPVLVLESMWKIAWLAGVAVPNLMRGDMSDQMSTVLFSVFFIVISLVVTPWDYVWKRYVVAAGDPWR